MKKIAITQRIIENSTYFEIRDALDKRWSKLLNKIGLLPIILPSQIDFKEYFKEFDIKGIFLTGGNDLYDLKKNTYSKQRDNFELELISYGIKNQVPIYGVCRGMQIIAKFFNSTFQVAKKHVGVNHKLKPCVQSKYFSQLNDIRKVNSYHDYCIKEIGKGLIISAKSDDNTIEAIEHKHLKIFAHMWHPEREKPFQKNQLDLIKSFFIND